MRTFRLVTTLLMVALCFNFVSCGDDDDTPTPNPEQKTKRLTSVTCSEKGATSSMKIEYTDGKVTKTVESYKGGSYQMEWISSYAYSGNTVTETLNVSNTDEGKWSKTISYTINNDGYATKGNEQDGGVWSFNYSGKYMTSATLIYQGNTDEDDKYTFNGEGLMTSNDYFDKIEYSDTPNLASIFLAYETEPLNTEYVRLQYAGLLGEAPKYLPKSAKSEDETYTFTYELDEDGYPKKATITSVEDGKTYSWTETYTYEPCE